MVSLLLTSSVDGEGEIGKPRIGSRHPPNVVEGQWFEGHTALHAARVHRRPRMGIAGTAKGGVDSIILSGGYIDDVYGDKEIIYTGEGGLDRSARRLVADQTMSSPGNAGLLLNQALGYPVRVIRGLGIKRGKATKGYEYRGLYRVADHWMTIGKDGFRICQFKLLKLGPGEEAQPRPVDPVEGETTSLEEQVRRVVAREQRIRDSKVVAEVKEMYDNACQICGTRLVVSPGGDAYSEAAHIHALGKPHDGPDKTWNVLCLCPNCHVLFDRGALQLTDDFDVIDGLTQKFVRALHRKKEHHLRVDCVRQHRGRWANREEESVVAEEAEADSVDGQAELPL
ncbi:YDG domain-containing protein OS=Streptomyces rimosus subsp. rimosus (strain ATCC / DSM 40260/ JCM 4667 / NRRL 2234) OX=1265868 GN=SRIM_019565 PE=4 SV=1 [Streptomyces rimosus subsp. rimosus]